MSEYTNVGFETARQIVSLAKEDDLAIRLDRFGAVPYLYHTPYNNNRGVTISMWSCLSFTFRPMPGKALLNHPTIVKPEREGWDDVRILTDEWVINKLTKSRQVETIPVDESPFANKVVGGWDD